MAQVLAPHAALGAWLDRVLAIGHHLSSPMSSTEALAVSAAFTVPALLGLGLSIRADNLPGRGVLLALTPPLLGTAVMALAVWLLQRGLGSLGLAPSPLRLLIEITTGIAVYAAYLRLVHRALWLEATTWLAQRRHQSVPAA